MEPHIPWFGQPPDLGKHLGGETEKAVGDGSHPLNVNDQRVKRMRMMRSGRIGGAKPMMPLKRGKRPKMMTEGRCCWKRRKRRG